MNGPENFEDKFAKEWQQAFEGAEQTPPASVWAGVDRELAYTQLAAYKAKNLYYKLAVAAMLLMAVSLGAFSYYYLNSVEDNQRLTGIIQVNAPIQASIPFIYIDDIGLNEKSGGTTQRVDGLANGDSGSFPNRAGQLENFSNTEGSPRYTAYLSSDDEDDRYELARSEGYLEVASLDRRERLVHQVDGLSVNSDVRAADLDRFMSPMPVYHFERQRLVAGNSEKYWAGFDVGSGNFDPNYRSEGSSLLSNSLSVNEAAFSLADNEAIDRNAPSVREGMSSGESVALGLNIGMKLGDRWSIESGIQYARADATTQTNVVIQSAQFQEIIPASRQVKGIAEVEELISNSAVVEYDYRDVNLENQFQFAAIPVKTGYRLIDKKFSLEVNAGFMANLYLGNRLSGQDQEIAEITIGPGSDSPYREISFSGLAGVQMGYRFLKNFDIILEPNYQRAINPLTKESSTFTANPTGFGVLTGIRYNFR